MVSNIPYKNLTKLNNRRKGKFLTYWNDFWEKQKLFNKKEPLCFCVKN